MTVQKDLIQVTGNRPKCVNKLIIKTTLLHANEQAAFRKLMEHPSLRLNEFSTSSLALVLRRALTLLSLHHEAIGTDPVDLELETECLFRLSRIGSAYKTVNHSKQ